MSVSVCCRQMRKANIERHDFRPALAIGRKELELSVLQKLCPIFWGEFNAFGYELRLSRRVKRGRGSRPGCDASADLEKEVFLAGR